MYRVLVVEDEPIAQKHIEKLIELYCKDFSVVGTANNGREALGMLGNLCPDLVVTDVKMPIMDGLELSSIINADYPDVYTIIVSGYQEFDYVWAALKNKVMDYLLKPITPQTIQKSFADAKKRMDLDYILQKKELIRKMVYTPTTQPKEVDRFFKKENYLAAIVRNGGLPRRATASFLADVFSDTLDKIIIFGRDEQESLFICPAEIFSPPEFRAMVEKHSGYLPPGYKTTIIYDRAFPQSELTAVIARLFAQLNDCCKVGQHNTATVGSVKKVSPPFFITLEVFQQIDPFIYTSNYVGLKGLLAEMLAKWQQRGLSNLDVERALNHILGYIVIRGNISLDVSIESMVEDLLFVAEDYLQLTESVMEICDQHFSNHNIYAKVDTPEFFQRVTSYIENNLQSPITLSGLCNIFHISQTYLSRLFKKYTQYTFNEYITKQRMQHAKTLLITQPELLIQEVATLVGYNDQFYFSRIFKGYTGLSPSDYLEEHNP